MDLVFGFYCNDINRESRVFKLHQFYPFYRYNVDYFNQNNASIFENKLLFAYESNINPGTGFDIWANVQNIDNISFDYEIYFPPANDDVLYQNFPNPVNNNTKIVYELLSFHKVKITIFDVRGRVVKVLVNKNQEAGLYNIDFDTSALSSGIYFCKMEAFKTRIIKMLVVK
jgi:hypothetical protein